MARNDFPSIDTRFIRETFLSDQFDRNFANPCIPPTDISRVGVIITSVVYMEREERGKRSIEEERVKMRFVIARHVDRGNALFFFFFLKRENNSLFSFSGKIDEEDFFDGRKFF